MSGTLISSTSGAPPSRGPRTASFSLAFRPRYVQSEFTPGVTYRRPDETKHIAVQRCTITVVRCFRKLVSLPRFKHGHRASVLRPPAHCLPNLERDRRPKPTCGTECLTLNTLFRIVITSGTFVESFTLRVRISNIRVQRSFFFCHPVNCVRTFEHTRHPLGETLQ